MGLPVSAVVANLYMEYFEQLALTSAMHRPRMRKRFVDDTLCIKGVDYLNGIRSSIQFTMESEFHTFS